MVYEQSTLAIDKETADKVKELARKMGITHLEAATQLLRFALRQGQIDFETVKTTVNLKEIMAEPDPADKKTVRRKRRRS